jgi:hypothetical protein
VTQANSVGLKPTNGHSPVAMSNGKIENNFFQRAKSKCLGEIITFHEPCFIRSLRQWVQKNAAGIALAEDFSLPERIRPSKN